MSDRARIEQLETKLRECNHNKISLYFRARDLLEQHQAAEREISEADAEIAVIEGKIAKAEEELLASTSTRQIQMQRRGSRTDTESLPLINLILAREEKPKELPKGWKAARVPTSAKGFDRYIASRLKDWKEQHPKATEAEEQEEIKSVGWEKGKTFYIYGEGENKVRTWKFPLSDNYKKRMKRRKSLEKINEKDPKLLEEEAKRLNISEDEIKAALNKWKEFDKELVKKQSVIPTSIGKSQVARDKNPLSKRKWRSKREKYKKPRGSTRTKKYRTKHRRK